MVCVVVSRNGEGDVWRHGDLTAARLHPISQPYDVFAESADQLLDQYGRTTAPSLLRFLDGRDVDRARSEMEGWRSARPSAPLPIETRLLIWDRVVKSARKPPTDPAEIVRIVADDRVAVEGVKLKSFGRRSSAESRNEHVDNMENDEMTEKREAFRMDDKGTITFGKDAEGKAYGPDNSPKRGEKTGENWKLYKSGMTVEQAMAAGLTRSNIRKDRRAGYIVVTNPPAPPAEAKKAEADSKTA